MTILIALVLSLATPAHAAEPPGVLLAQARSHARHGDHDAMRQAAEQALAQPGNHQREAQLIIAASYELDDELERALAIYDALVDAYPRRDVPAVLALRQADVLGQLERFSEAKRALRPLRNDHDLHPDRALQVQMLTGLWDLERGKDARGLKAIDAALEMSAASPWWRAKGHLALVNYALAQASAFPIGHTAEETMAALELRAQLVGLAQEQTVKLIQLDQASAAQQALLALADLHEHTGVQLATKDNSDPRVEGLMLKALAYVDRTVALASRTDASPETLIALSERRAALRGRIEAL
jgi:tetratricopeptide (TPR) repeat protein